MRAGASSCSSRAGTRKRALRATRRSRSSRTRHRLFRWSLRRPPCSATCRGRGRLLLRPCASGQNSRLQPFVLLSRLFPRPPSKSTSAAYASRGGRPKTMTSAEGLSMGLPPTSPAVPYSHIRAQLDTGDLFFLHTTTAAGAMIEWLEHYARLPPYSHIPLGV